MTARTQTDWQAYATVYDLIAEHNPAYQELLVRFRREIRDWPLSQGDLVVDLGAGTGNFSLALAEAFPRCRVVHIDGNEGMNAIAAAKAAARGLANVDIRTQDVAAARFAPGSVAAVTAIHALYAFPSPEAVVGRMVDWLAPDGRLFACDPGRVIDTREWTRYIFKETIRRRGLWPAVRLYVRAAAGARQNRRIARQQAGGDYWLHGLDDFRRTFEDAGLDVQRAFVTYRGCSDVVVGRKPVPVAVAASSVPAPVVAGCPV